ncbi:MAG TPA: hypothetical protein VED87_12350 [Methylocystis sp.]|nr:hypothetical protein [Methylocystis sp.]
MENRYGRAQFLRDAVSLGLPAYLAFSRTALRRQRDRLMREHHPDCGGDENKAREINEIYARMLKWLDSRRKTAASPADGALGEQEPETIAPKHSQLLHQVATTALWAVALIASTYFASRKKAGPGP